MAFVGFSRVFIGFSFDFLLGFGVFFFFLGGRVICLF